MWLEPDFREIHSGTGCQEWKGLSRAISGKLREQAFLEGDLLGFFRETEPIKHVEIHKRILLRELPHMVMEVKETHDRVSAS